MIWDESIFHQQHFVQFFSSPFCVVFLYLSYLCFQFSLSPFPFFSFSLPFILLSPPSLFLKCVFCPFFSLSSSTLYGLVIFHNFLSLLHLGFFLSWLLLSYPRFFFFSSSNFSSAFPSDAFTWPSSTYMTYFRRVTQICCIPCHPRSLGMNLCMSLSTSRWLTVEGQKICLFYFINFFSENSGIFFLGVFHRLFWTRSGHTAVRQAKLQSNVTVRVKYLDEALLFFPSPLPLI